MDHVLFIHESVAGHVGHVHILAVVNNPGVNMGVQISFETLFSVLLGLFPQGAGANRHCLQWEVRGSLRVVRLEPSSPGSAQGTLPWTLGLPGTSCLTLGAGPRSQVRAGKGCGLSYLLVRIETPSSLGLELGPCCEVVPMIMTVG